MITIDLIPGSQKNHLRFDKEANTFFGSERNIKFATEYEVKNTISGKSEKFEFTHSTGPEFDSATQWVYKSESGILLIIGNDAEITKLNAEAYLKHKTENL